MAQMTWRGDDELLERVRHAAEAGGWSVNRWVTLVLYAATDPELATDEADRVRERLARAGLLEVTGSPVGRPDPDRVAHARRAAGRSTPLSDLVADGRR